VSSKQLTGVDSLNSALYFYRPMANPYPTQRQEQAMKDVAAHPDATLEQRRSRLGITRAGVHAMLGALEKKGLMTHEEGGHWSLTSPGKKWLKQKRA